MGNQSVSNVHLNISQSIIFWFLLNIIICMHKTWILVPAKNYFNNILKYNATWYRQFWPVHERSNPSKGLSPWYGTNHCHLQTIEMEPNEKTLTCTSTTCIEQFICKGWLWIKRNRTNRDLCCTMCRIQMHLFTCLFIQGKSALVTLHN